MQNLQQLEGEDLQIEELQAFIAVVQSGSFTAAAALLQKDASVISKRVKHLEQRLQTSLLMRTTRLVRVTEAGDLYFHRVQTILDELKTAGRELADLTSRPQGLLRISLPNTFGRRLIVPLLPKLMKMYPELRIDARFTDRFVDIVSEGFDATIRLGRLGDSSLKARKLSQYRNMLVASPDYLATKGAPGKPADLNSHSCLGFVSHASWPYWPLSLRGKSETVRPHGQLITDNSELLLEAALQGGGIILSPDWLVQEDLKAGRLVEVLEGWAGGMNYGVFIVLPPGRMVPAKTRAFIDFIADAIH